MDSSTQRLDIGDLVRPVVDFFIDEHGGNDALGFIVSQTMLNGQLFNLVKFTHGTTAFFNHELAIVIKRFRMFEVTSGDTESLGEGSIHEQIREYGKAMGALETALAKMGK